jgi:hypothetical protein
LADRNQGVDMGRNLGNQIKPVCQQRKGGNASVDATLGHFGLRHLLGLNGSGRTANQRNELGAGVGRGGWCNRKRRGRGNLRR